MNVGARRVAVSVVLFHADLDWAVRGLASLVAQRPAPAAVLVHCNADEGAEAAKLSTRLGEVGLADAVHVSSSADNLGFCGAHNRALAAAFADGADAVLVANADLLLEPDALDALARRADALGRPVLVGPVLTLADATGADEGRIDTTGIFWTASGRHFDARQGEPTDRAPQASVEVAGISGACLYVQRSAYELIVAASGEFFDELFIAYREDAELGYRAQLLGIPCWLEPSARGRHARALRGTSRAGSAWVNQLGVQNRFLIAFKYGRRRPGSAVAPWLRDLVVVGAVLLHERSSLRGLACAVRLWPTARSKGRRVLSAVPR
jgi:GT2 family glycosyltransferase